MGIKNSISTDDFKANFKIKKNGDLLYKTHLEVDLPDIQIYNKNDKFPGNTRTIFYTSNKKTTSDDGGNGLDEKLVECLPEKGKTNIFISKKKNNCSQ